jgi:hypothetical protein
MRIAKFHLMLLLLGTLTVLVFSGCQSQYYGMKLEPYPNKDLVYIAHINVIRI